MLCFFLQRYWKNINCCAHPKDHWWAGFILGVSLVTGLPLHHPGDGVRRSSEPAVCWLPSAARRCGARRRDGAPAALPAMLYWTCKLGLLVPLRSGGRMLLLHPTVLKYSSDRFEE